MRIVRHPYMNDLSLFPIVPLSENSIRVARKSRPANSKAPKRYYSAHVLWPRLCPTVDFRSIPTTLKRACDII